MPSGERPRERLLRYGPSALSNAELLAILLRVGLRGQNVLELAQSLLAKFEGLGGLARASAGELTEFKGMGEAKTAQVLAALELGKRLPKILPEDCPQIKSPEDVVRVVRAEMEAEMTLLDQEHVRAMLLDAKHRLQFIAPVYVGKLDGVDIRVADVFREAVRRNSSAIVVVHNHPSGDPSPSAEDVRVTKQMKEAGHLLGIEVLDHIILAGNRHVSLKERGLGF
jgi:DNA repair protein RadC